MKYYCLKTKGVVTCLLLALALCCGSMQAFAQERRDDPRDRRGGIEAAPLYEWGGRDKDGRNTFAARNGKSRSTAC